MAFDIGDVDLQVRTVDDITRASDVEAIVQEVLRRLASRASDAERHDRDVRMWNSVREGRPS